MNLPEGFDVKPKSSSTSRARTMQAPVFFNSFAAAKAIEKGKEKEKAQPPVEFKRRPPPQYVLDPALQRSLAEDKARAALKAKPSSSKATGKSVLRPPSFALTSAAAQSKAAAKTQSSLKHVEYKTLPIPFFNAAAGPSSSKAPAPPFQKSSSSSSQQGWKFLDIPKFTLPHKKPAIDPEKLKNMVTPSTTKFALATNPTTEAGARGLAKIMAEHKAKNAEPSSSSWDRGMMMSPEKRDAKGRWKFVKYVSSCTIWLELIVIRACFLLRTLDPYLDVTSLPISFRIISRLTKCTWSPRRGGMAARVSDYYKSSATATSLWQHEMDYNMKRNYPTGAHHLEVRIVKIVKRPFSTRHECESRSAAGRFRIRRLAPRFKRTTTRRKPPPMQVKPKLKSKSNPKPKFKSKPLPPHLKPKNTAIALCEVMSSHYRTRELIRIIFVYGKDPAKEMFKPKDAPWREGAIVKLWRPWSGFAASAGPEEPSPFMLRSRRAKANARGIQIPWMMDVDKPTSRKRLRAEAMGDDGLDSDLVMLGKPPHKRPKLNGDPQRKSKPLPLPSNTPMSIEELKKLPVGKTVLVVKRFMVMALTPTERKRSH